MRMKRQSKYIIGIIEVLLVTLLLNTNVYAAGKQCDRTSADQRYNVKRENDTEKNKNLEELNSKYNLEELFNNIVLEKEQKKLKKNK